MASISARKNKKGEIISYRIRVSHGYDIKGNKLKPYEMTYKPDPEMTEKQIEKELHKQAILFEEKCKLGLLGDSTNLLFSDFCDQYLEIMKDRLSPTTLEYYNSAIHRLFKPALGHLKLKNIKTIHIQSFINQLSENNIKQKRDNSVDGGKLSAASIKRNITILQSIFKQAVKIELISESPAKADKLTIPKVTVPKIDIFTKQEAAEMLSYLEQEEIQFQVFVQLAIMTGARRGELTALKFSDFDYDNKKVTIERAAVKLKGKPTQIKAHKDYEVRTVAINQYCIDLVKLLRIEKNKKAKSLGIMWHENDWLFTQDNGEIMNPQTPTKQFSKFLKKNHLKHRKLHSLRHTSATLLLYGGVNIKQVQERLGHGDITTTNKYLHYISEADEQAANILQDMLITHKLKEKKQA